MALRTRWKLLVTLAVASIAAACSNDSGSTANTKSAADAGSSASSALVGSACLSRDQCPTGNQCRLQQGFGALTTVLMLPGIEAPGGYCSNDCLTNTDCGQGAICLGALVVGTQAAAQLKGECRRACKADSDCRDGYECAKSLDAGGDAGVASAGLMALALPPSCQAKPAVQHPGADLVGKSCNTAADCPGGSCNGTYCTATCNTKDDSTCGANAACLTDAAYGSSGSCEETCKVDTDCQQYMVGGDTGCIDVDGRKFCGPKTYPLEPNIVGKACADDTQCGNYGMCTKVLGPTASPAPGGYCTLMGCADATDCGGGTCIGNGATSRCYATCSADTDCRAGYNCIDRATSDMKMAKVCGVIPAAADGGTPATVTKPDASTNGLDAGVGDAG